MEDFNENQLLKFCQQVGLAKDGWLDEKELLIVCKYLGFSPPKEMMNQLFHEIGGNEDVKISLNLLIQQLDSMHKSPDSPIKSKNIENNLLTEAPSEENSRNILDLLNYDAKSPTFMDPKNTGVVKTGFIVDTWCHFGINEEKTIRTLKNLGLFISSRATLINISDLYKVMEEEVDTCKEMLSSALLASLMTYKTEAQYLRYVFVSMEKERDKLRSDILEGNQRSKLLAQEIDEQNARIEKKGQLDLLKAEAKHSEQFNELSIRFESEKEALQQTILCFENKLDKAQEENLKLKTELNAMKQENVALDKEVANLNDDVETITKKYITLKTELEEYEHFDEKYQDLEKQMERAVLEKDQQLQQAQEIIKKLTDRNDELSAQILVKKDTGLNDSNGFKNLDRLSSINYMEIKDGGDTEDLDSSLDAQNNSLEFQLQPGVVPVPHEMSLAACMGESSSDSPKESPPRDPSSACQSGFFSIDCEMKELKEDYCDLKTASDSCSDTGVQTEVDVSPEQIEKEWKEKIAEIEKLKQKNEISLKERIGTLEKSLEMLRSEYEQCEDYWHNKLAEERDTYERERVQWDDKLSELAEKIKEYETLFLSQAEQCMSTRLQPIDENAELELQVTDLQEECDKLAKKIEQMTSEMQTCEEETRKEWEKKLFEESSQFEQQINALKVKCHEYETRLSSLVNEEKSPFPEVGNAYDSLQERITELEVQMKQREEEYKKRLINIENCCKDKRFEMGPQDPCVSLKLQSRSLLELMHQNHRAELPCSAIPIPHASNICTNSTSKTNKCSSLPFIANACSVEPSTPQDLTNLTWEGTVIRSPSVGTNSAQFSQNHVANGKKAWCQIEVGWLQSLRMKLKQKEDYCMLLQKTLQNRELLADKIISEMKSSHEAETANWENFMQATQELIRQQNIKYRDQGEKLRQTKILIQDLWFKNTKLMNNINFKEEKIKNLQNYLRFYYNRCQGLDVPSHDGDVVMMLLSNGDDFDCSNHSSSSPQSMPDPHSQQFF